MLNQLYQQYTEDHRSVEADFLKSVKSFALHQSVAIDWPQNQDHLLV